MPSGAKKRKAAKKKKEKETEINTNHPSTTNPQGNDEVKSQDEKGSDGGSPTHGEHDLAFNEEEEERDPSAAQPSHAAAASKDFEEVPGDANRIDETEGGKEGIVVIEWDMKSEGSESKDVSVGHVESAKESDNGNANGNSSSSSSSSSSSDEIGTLKNSKDESHNSVNETVAFDELVKSMDSLHAKMASITENWLAEETGDLVAGSSAAPVKAEASVPEVQSVDNDDKEHSSFDENVRTISLEEPKPREFDSEVSASVSQSPIPESTIDAEHVKDSDTPECSDNQPLVASVPPVVQKTSWLSCCGLFDVLSGSNR